MTLILAVIITGVMVYRSVKRIKERYVPSVPDGKVRIMIGVVLLLIGLPLFLYMLFMTPEQPEITVVDILLVFPLMIKAIAGGLMKAIGEIIGFSITAAGALVLAWGIAGVRKSGDSDAVSADSVTDALEELDRQFRKVQLTEAEYENRKWQLLCGSGTKPPDS